MSSKRRPRLVHMAQYTPTHEGSFVPMMRSVLERAQADGWEAIAVFPEKAAKAQWFDSFSDAGIQVRLTAFPGRLKMARWIRALIAESDAPTVIHTHFRTYDVPAAAAASRALNAAVYWHIHTVLHETRQMKLRNAAKFATYGPKTEAIFCPAENIADTMRSRRGPEDLIEVFPSPIEVDRFPLRSSEERLAAKRLLGVPEDGLAVMTFARDWQIKGGDVFVETCARLSRELDERVIPIFHYGGEVGEREARAAGLESMEIGRVDDIGDLFAASDIFLAPSRGEGMPFSVIESMCTGTPVIASDLPGHRFLPSEMPAMRVVERNADAFTDATLKTIQRRPQQHEDCAEARAWIAENLSLAEAADRLMKRYEESRERLEGGASSDEPDEPDPGAGPASTDPADGEPGSEQTSDPEDTRLDTPQTNAAFALIVRLSSAFFTAALTLYLVRALGPDGYGLFALAVSLGAIIAIPADFGVSLSAARYVAENRHRLGVVKRVLTDAAKVKALVAGLLCGALALLAEPIANGYDEPGLVDPLRITAIAVFFQTMGLLYTTWSEAQGQVRRSLSYQILESTSEAGSTVVLVLLGAGVVGAAAGRAIGFTLAGIFALYVTARLLSRVADVASDQAPRIGTIVRYGTALLVIDSAISLFTRLDVIIIGAILGAGAAGLYEAPLRLLTFLRYGAQALSSGFAPGLARPEGREHRARAFWRAFRGIIVLQMIFVAPLIVWANPLATTFLGEPFAESADVLIALSPFVVLSGLAVLLASGVNYLGRARQRIWLAIGALIINFGIDIVLIPEIGIIAGAIGSVAAFLLYVPGHIYIARKEIGFPAREVTLTLVRSLVAAAAAAGVLAFFGTQTLLWWEWFAGSMLATAAYVAVLFALREVDVVDVVGILDRIGTRLVLR